MTSPPATADASLVDDALTALDVAPAIIRDLDGTVRFWSRGAEQLYGFSREQALGRRSHDLLTTHFPQPLASIEATLAADGTWHGELEHRASDGRRLIVASNWVLRRDARGAPDRVVEINQDISFQQPQLLATRRLAAIVESSSDAIVGKTLDGIVTHWNSAAKALFGYSAEEIVGQPILLLFSPGTEAEEAAIMQRVRQGEKISARETVRRRKDGSLVPVSLTVSPIRDEHGAIVGASTILRDLTQQQERDRRLREAQAELFHVQRLTELGQLVSSLVHEVNQPLAAVGNYAAAGRRLLAAGQSNGTNAALQKITEQTERAHQIIQRLRNFVRKGDTAQERQDLTAMIDEAVALASVSLARGGTTIETRLGVGTQHVVADRVQIQQVLFNLLRNALEAMEQAERRQIAIVAQRVDAGRVEVSVADTGPGLPQEVRANLFRPFVTTKDGGMGVGLSICRAIVEAHGGHLQAEDNPGGGTVFRFTLGLAPDGSDVTPL